jgi:hypothetical protein
MSVLVKKNSATLIAGLLLLGVLFRFAQVAVQSYSGGRATNSPDQKFLAVAEDFYKKKFWGGTHDYYEFTINTPGGERVQHILMDEPPQGMIDWREDGEIQWASNSASVTYIFKGGRMTLDVNP